MSVGSPIDIQKLNADGEWVDYMRLHCMNVNKTRQTEYVEAAGEQSGARVTFRVRWSRMLAPIEFATSEHRVLWRGQKFNIVSYDDFQYQHRRVDLGCVSYG